MIFLFHFFSSFQSTLLRLKSNKSTNITAELSIRYERLKNNRDQVFLDLSGQQIAKKDFAGKSDPFIEIFKLNSASGEILVYRTEVRILGQNVFFWWLNDVYFHAIHSLIYSNFI